MSSDGEGNGGDRPTGAQTHVTTAVGATTVDGKVGDPYLERASSALMSGDWTAAEDAFFEGVTASPMDARLHGGLALIAIHSKDWDRAISHGRQASALPGASVEVHNNLGWALEQSDRGDQAILAYQAAFRLDPTRPQPVGHLVRLGQMPLMEDEEDGPPVSIGTLQRLELYEHLAEFLQAEPPGTTFRGAYIWAMERGAPWGRVAAWLTSQGVHKDSDVLQVLSRRDEHLGEAVITGMLLGERDAIRRALQSLGGTRVIGPGESIPKFDGIPGENDSPYLIVRVDPSEDRAQIPVQRTHAGVVLSLLISVIEHFGENAGLVLSIDSAAHLGPRRVWLITPMSEVEVIGTWAVEDAEGNPVEDVPVPDGRTVRADSVMLGLPGLDASSLGAALQECGLSDTAHPIEAGGGVIFDADRVGREDGWRSFLERVCRWIPEGERSFAVWREEGDENLAILERGSSRFLRLVPLWPEDQSDLDLPIPPEVQVLGRVLFHAPRAGRLMGVRGT